MRKTIIAIDDEPLALVLVERYLDKTDGWELVSTFTDSQAALDFLKCNKVDLVLSDINMPDMTGLQFVDSLPPHSPFVIFITAHKQHAVRSYELEVLDYLVKPVPLERFQKALLKAKEWIELKNNTDKGPIYIFVYSEYQLVKIDVNTISYIKSMGDYVKIHLTIQSRPIVTLKRLKDIAQELAIYGFIQIHRSHIVNYNMISAIQKNRVMIDGDWLSVSDTYRNNLDNF